MGTLTPDQRNYIYLLEAERVGIHKPILTALYAVQLKPNLPEGETGLGISPANQVLLMQVNTVAGQVQIAANTIRSLTEQLIANGASSENLWNQEQGCYSDLLLQHIARGYAPPPADNTAARLEPCDLNALRTIYLQDVDADHHAAQLPANLAYLDAALLSFAETIPDWMAGLPHQREALIEALRIWRRLDTRQVAIKALTMQLPSGTLARARDESYLDPILLQFIQQIPRNYGSYPHQREALLRLVQLWRQLSSREVAIASLANNTSPQDDLSKIDAALIAFVLRIPKLYQGKGDQRNALVEGFRDWQQLESRPAALVALGINPSLLSGSTPDTTEVAKAGARIDRELLAFIRRLPRDYQETEQQREALLRMTQLWHDLGDRDATIQFLVTDMTVMERARRGTQDAPPRPSPMIIPRRPATWTVETIQLHAAIIPNGSFTWAEATAGGQYLPIDETTLEAIICIAELVQQARDRINRPLHVATWYKPANGDTRTNDHQRHSLGDAIDFYCDGLVGNQLYWFLDPWWPGGLGRYYRYPYLCYVDARNYRTRWSV